MDFDHSLRINPLFTNGYHYRAITKSRFGEYEEALGDLQTAINLRPGFYGLYFSRGVTYFLAQQFDKAVGDFDKYIRHEPEDPSAYLNRGASYLFLADTTKALNDYNKAIHLDRFEPEGFIRRARVFADRGEMEKALDDMDHAIELDSTNTLAHFNRALMRFDAKNYRGAMSDLDLVLQYEPGNALTLYNRSLIRAQLSDFEGALDDMDRVININPGNVLAYFNRASYFIELGRMRSALSDYDKAIALYPDFAKAYMNRAYVKNLLGMQKESKSDYDTARRKIDKYRSDKASGADFADTTRKFNSLIALDADFAKKDFDNELLQHRDIDVRLRPLYRIQVSESADNTQYAFSGKFESADVRMLAAKMKVDVEMASSPLAGAKHRSLYGYDASGSDVMFVRAMDEVRDRKFNAALRTYDAAVENCSDERMKAFMRMNRGVLRAEMIDFIANIESNVQTLSMDDQGAAKARVSDRTERHYDYSEAIEDMESASRSLPTLPYVHFNLGNLYCLSTDFVRSLSSYDEAIRLFPGMGDAYFNRGLVLILLKDKEKGCFDLSHAGELGVKEAYGVISKYCKEDD
ncbi:MAG: tetratricopeptide repeat protein [Bacteroidales bacterium]|nr:tetratricopeptide repeat protein [Bacteroidales bacterium]